MKREDQTLGRKAAAVLAPVLALLTAFLLAITTLAAMPDEAQATSSSEIQTMYRLYNPNSGEHFYTASEFECGYVEASGWTYEGVAWTAPVKSNTPVYRLYSGTDHHYTTSVAEKNMLVKAGWKYENIGWYSDDAKGVPLYRQFNPNVDPNASFNNSGSHNYTTSKSENDHLVSLGWIAEDIGWYGMDTSSEADTGNDDNGTNEDPSTSNERKVSYTDDVTVVEEGAAWVSDDGLTATISSFDSADIAVGDIMVLYPTKDNPLGQTIRVESMWEAAEGGVTVSGGQPEVEEVLNNVNISGTFKGDASDFRLADGTTLQTQSGDFVEMKLVESKDGKIVINLANENIYDVGSITGTLTIDPRVETDIRLNSFNRRLKVALVGDADLDFEAKLALPDENMRARIGTLPILGTEGFGILLELYLVADAEGSVSIEVEADFNAWVDTTADGNKAGASVTAEDPGIEAEISGKGGIESMIVAAIAGYSLVDIAIQCGSQFDANLTAHSSLTCIDLKAWIYAQYSYHVLSDLFDKLSNGGVDVFDEDNSPFKCELHFENGEIVDECTWSKTGDNNNETEGGTIEDGPNTDPDEKTGSDTELGDDSKEDVTFIENTCSVSLGCNYSAAIKRDGTLWMWGDNDYGQLGDDTTIVYRTTPVKVMDNVASVSLGGYQSAVVKADGTLWMWGKNSSGQLGDGTTSHRYTPVKVMDNVVSVSLGENHTAAIKRDGTLWMWGDNRFGQLGDGTTADRYTPVKIMDNVASASLGNFHSAAIKPDGSLWMWGDNGSGQLGDGTKEHRYTPVKIIEGVKI